MIARFHRPGFAPNRPLVSGLALDHENLPRVLAAMGFDERVASVRRGEIVWWRPDYQRMPDAGLIRARYGEAHASAFLAHRREELAAVNRGIAGSIVHVMLRHDPELIVCVDGDTGEWRSHNNAVRGDDLVALASLMWGCGLAAACHRLARACGLAEAPVADVG